MQPAADLVESLVEPVTDEHEDLWEEVVNTELVYTEIQEQRQRRQPSTGVTESAYRLEDIRSFVSNFASYHHSANVSRCTDSHTRA